MPSGNKMRKVILVFLLLLLVFLPFYFSRGQKEFSTVPSKEQPEEVLVRIRSYDIYHSLLVNTVIEHLVIVFAKGWMVTITSNEMGRCVIPSNLPEILKEWELDLSDAVFIIHNHWVAPRFSVEDKKLYFWLRDRGFTGRFLIYVTASNKIIELQE